MNEMLFQLIASGLVTGAVYALVGIGLIVIYRSTEIVNFAQGEMVMLGAFLGVFAMQVLDLPYSLAFIFAVLGTGVMGWLVDRISYRPLNNAPHMTQVLATLAIANILQGAAILVWGTRSYSYPVSDGLSPAITSPVVLNQQQVLILVATLMIMVVMWAFFSYSRSGKAMRALSQNRLGAALAGVNVTRVFSISWMLSAALGGAAGVLYGPLTLVDAGLGWLLIKGFAVAILGGFGSLPGAAIGGLILGVVENVWSLWFPALWAPIVAYAFIILVLLIKPSGLLGESLQRKL